VICIKDILTWYCLRQFCRFSGRSRDYLVEMNVLEKFSPYYIGLRQKLYRPGKHPDDQYGWIMTPELLRAQTLQVQQAVELLVDGAPFEEVTVGFDGRICGERILEYPYFVDWYMRNGCGPRLLDIGCVLNNQAVAPFIKDHIEILWFCNPAVEALVAEIPTYYHVSKLDSAFPGGEQFERITCLSTIEHIGYDNSQYGAVECAIYQSATNQPLIESVEKIFSLLVKGGAALLSVPFGLRAVNVHRVTKKKAFQSFDWNSAEAVQKCVVDLGGHCQFGVYAGNRNGWGRLENPEAFHEPYGHGFPGAPAVLMIELYK
jgi:hypothetical protein